MQFQEKYLKYKKKYLLLKKQIGGSTPPRNNLNYINPPGAPNARRRINPSQPSTPINQNNLNASPPNNLNNLLPNNSPPSTPLNQNNRNATPAHTPLNQNILYVDTPINNNILDSLFENVDFNNLLSNSDQVIHPEIDNDGLFSCINNFDIFISSQLSKKNINSIFGPTLRFKSYSKNTDILSWKSLFIQTLLHLDQQTIGDNDFINHTFYIKDSNSNGIDQGGLKRQFLTDISNQIEYIFNNNLIDPDFNKKNLAVILEMIYNFRSNLNINIDIKQIFKNYFIDENKNIIELIENTECSNISFSKLLLNFIYHKFMKYEMFNTIEKIKIILKKENNVSALLYIFAEYINQKFDQNNYNYFDYILQLTNEEVNDYLWEKYNLSNDFEIIINHIKNFKNYNLFQLYSHFRYNEYIDSELLIKRINFDKIDNDLIEKFKIILTDYKIAVNNNSNIDKETIKNLESIGDQQNFLKILLQYWSGSTHLHNEYILKYEPSIEDFFHAHTCFYTLDTRVPSNISLYDLVYSLLVRINDKFFSTAG
jgi:hypothetical protein